MNHAPTIDTALLAGLRKVISNGAALNSGISAFFATERIPARSILRSVYFAVDADHEGADDVTLQLTTGNAAPPAASDFVGTGRLLPNAGFANATPEYTADPLHSARDIAYNFILPDLETRILIRVTNNAAVTIEYRLRLIVDGLGRIGR